MVSRRLALTDVSGDAAHAFRSMLEVLNGRTSCTWQLVESIEHAEVVVTGNTGRFASPPMQLHGKRVVAVIESADVRVRPNTPYVLTHPFRVMQVLSVLDEIADDYKRPELRIVHNASASHWDFAESVRALRAAISTGPWYRTHTAEGAEIVVSGNLHNFACEPAVFEQIRVGATTLSSLAPASVQSVPSRYVRRPLLELLWHSAYHSGSALSPWLDAHGSFQLRRWPDFGTISSTRQHLQLVAMLAKRSRSRAQLAQAADAPIGEVDRLLNALSLCDLLVSEHFVQPARAPATSALPGFIRSLLGSLRRTLDLAL
jgi:hypothetical protein